MIKPEIIQWKSNHKIRQRMVETQKRMIRKGDSLENAADSGEEKLSEQVEELLSEDVKNQKANSDENLNSQHKKTASIVIIIVILLILLWNIPMRTRQKAPKGGTG